MDMPWRPISIKIPKPTSIAVPSLSTRADQYTNRSGRISCRMVVAISSMDLVVLLVKILHILIYMEKSAII